ncbi:hypothetical protein [Actinocrispum wychmicini]|uniref:Uncharacterized protein n=1 Tax=Actinocrispum wychmicini TaxID=1213861 RepID=A0A4V2S7B3_9PSEU|nr:hypothetical protein [Actinocrispum wychmicini]TCO59280.1 hypothetical protein EV192_104121 [Actinocrispum wychmicini]
MTSTLTIADLTEPSGVLDVGHGRARVLIRVFHLLAQGLARRQPQTLRY